MKRTLITILITMCFASSSYADVFGPKRYNGSIQKVGTLKANESTEIAPEISMEPETIVDHLDQIIEYLGPREGGFFDFSEGEYCNYIAATIYTYDPIALSFNIGMLNTDGVAGTIDYNVGRHIPCEDVPILNIFEYLYVGGGVGSRYLDDGSDKEKWKIAYGIDAQFKITW